MTDYILVHGAWHGSWCGARVRHLLAAGARGVFTPTLTGVGERSGNTAIFEFLRSHPRICYRAFVHFFHCCIA